MDPYLTGPRPGWSIYRDGFRGVSKTPLPSQVPAPDPQLLLKDEAREPLVSGPLHQRMLSEVTSGSLCPCATHSWCSRGPTAHRARAEVRPRSFTFRLKPLSSHMNLVSFCHFVSHDTVLHSDTPSPGSPTSFTLFYELQLKKKKKKKNVAPVNQCLLRRPWFQTHCILGSHKAPPTHLLFSWLHANSSHEWV